MKTRKWLMIAAMGLMLTACQEKKQPYNIIVKKE